MFNDKQINILTKPSRATDQAWKQGHNLNIYTVEVTTVPEINVKIYTNQKVYSKRIYFRVFFFF